MTDPRPQFLGEPAADLGGAAAAGLGAGGGGAAAAWGLAGAGVGRLELADRDALEPDNLRRHVCGRADLGRPKPEAVADFLRDRLPAAVVRMHAFCFLDQPGRLRELLAGV